MSSSTPGTDASSLALDKRYRTLPGGIWALGLGAMFMDTSSELVHSLLPVFMTSVLGASMFTIGVVEGIAEATAAITKVFSGAISDYLGKRKFLVVLGYGLGAITKPIFPLANSIGWVLTARFVDRVGKGIRGAPRDALVADITPAELRGAAYGLRQALDSVGAFVGPLLAVICMAWLADDIRAVLWVAVIPVIFTLALIVFGVEEPDREVQSSRKRVAIVPTSATQLPSAYWLIVLVGAVFTLARFSQAFLAGAALWGLHMALTEGLFSKLVADSVPAELRGTGFGIYNLVSGVVLLFASVIAGALWSTIGAAATFLAGAGFAAVTALALIVYRPKS
jgi:Na+/melibiose symporter-like transporter